MSITSKIRTIHFDAPSVGELEKEYLAKAIDSGFVSSVGPFVGEFESRFAQYLDAPKAVATQSGTAALHMALHEIGIKSGEEVVVPALTFVATANPVIYLGATPVFVDVDRKTWNIDPQEIKKKITKRTKAIVPVHLYGNPCDMDAIMDIAQKNGLFVIEDATESLGATYKGKHTGTIGDFGCFSFNGNKVITTGGGGMVVGRDFKQLKHIKYLVNQAKGEEPTDELHGEIGFNSRMTNIEAAVGLAQMEKLEEFLEKKKRFSEIYRKELEGYMGIEFQAEYEGAKSSWWCVCIKIADAHHVERIRSSLAQKEIPTKRILKPVPDYAPYKKYTDGRFPAANELYNASIALPTSTLNSDDDVKEICDAIKELI